jgi:hypothetical protein
MCPDLDKVGAQTFTSGDRERPCSIFRLPASLSTTGMRRKFEMQFAPLSCGTLNVDILE